MAYYKKKPVVIEAMQWTGDNITEILFWMGQYHNSDTKIKNGYLDAAGEFIIKTLEGQHVASIGDWIIKGVHNEFYPCKPDIFDKSYELVGERIDPLLKFPEAQ